MSPVADLHSTRMYSSRMRTVCCSGRLPGVCLPRWGVFVRGVSAQGVKGVCPGDGKNFGGFPSKFNFLHFRVVFGKFRPNNRLTPDPFQEVAPLVNPGSVTVIF